MQKPSRRILGAGGGAHRDALASQMPDLVGARAAIVALDDVDVAAGLQCLPDGALRPAKRPRRSLLGVLGCVVRKTDFVHALNISAANPYCQQRRCLSRNSGANTVSA